MLLLVPIIGKEVGGNKAWIGIGSFGIQPSEFAKFATALVVAKMIGSIGFKMDNLRNQAMLFAVIGAPILLILLQKDYGTALVFMVFMLVYYREGMSPFLLLLGLSPLLLNFLIPFGNDIAQVGHANRHPLLTALAVPVVKIESDHPQVHASHTSSTRVLAFE